MFSTKISSRTALTFAAGELVGEMVESMVKLDQIQKFLRTVLDFLSWPFAQMQRQGYLFKAI